MEFTRNEKEMLLELIQNTPPSRWPTLEEVERRHSIISKIQKELAYGKKGNLKDG